MKTNHFGFVIKYIMFLLDKDYWEIRKTKDKGKGVFAMKPIGQGSLIGDYVGKLVHLNDVDFDNEKKKLYLMYYNDEFGIYHAYMAALGCCDGDLPYETIIGLDEKTITKKRFHDIYEVLKMYLEWRVRWSLRRWLVLPSCEASERFGSK